MEQAAAILRFDAIHRSFFGVPVLKGIGFDVGPGRVVGLVGENGAGKSTLMNILGGVLPADSGSMTLAGQPYNPRDCREAARRGIAFVHQELNLFTNLSIAENLAIESLPAFRLAGIPLPLVDRRSVRRRAEGLLAAVDLNRPPDTPISALSPGERQLVEIAKAVGADARILILDEPTTSLTTPEAERLFALIGRFRARGMGIIYISHRLEDVFQLCDDLVVLRDGQVVGQGLVKGFTVARTISLMVGRSIEQIWPPRNTAPSREAVLDARGLCSATGVRDVSLTLHRGEVLGLAGLMGAGRTELARLLFGLDPLQAGEVRINGEPHTPTPRASIQRGMAFVTENRREEGLLMEDTILRNTALVRLPAFARTPLRWIRSSLMARTVEQASRSVRLGGVTGRRQAAKTLSGGNQQKVVLAKWLLNHPSILILDEPTRGIDVGAKQEVYRIISELAAQGTAVLMISSEIEELIGMCDRILVMASGRIRDEVARDQFDRERILRAALQGVMA